jgi:hypothetical protein
MPPASELTARALDLAEKCAAGLEATKTQLQAIQATLKDIEERTASCGRNVERAESRERWVRVEKVADIVVKSDNGKRLATALCGLVIVLILAVTWQVAAWAGIPSYIVTRFAEPVTVPVEVTP